MAKIVSFKTACLLSKRFGKEGKKVIFTSGRFDILHIGHVRFLQLVRKWGGKDAILLVGVDTDEFLSINKGPFRPIFNQRVRAEILSNLSGVDYVVLLTEKVAKLAPSPVFVKRYKEIGADVVVCGNTEPEIMEKIREQVREAGCKFKYLPHKTKVVSSSKIGKLVLDRFPT